MDTYTFEQDMKRNRCERSNCQFFVKHYQYNVMTCGASRSMNEHCKKQHEEYVKEAYKGIYDLCKPLRW